jgi:hypothetical protein
MNTKKQIIKSYLPIKKIVFNFDNIYNVFKDPNIKIIKYSVHSMFALEKEYMPIIFKANKISKIAKI